jgi:hypothetical protein
VTGPPQRYRDSLFICRPPPALRSADDCHRTFRNHLLQRVTATATAEETQADDDVEAALVGHASVMLDRRRIILRNSGQPSRHDQDDPISGDSGRSQFCLEHRGASARLGRRDDLQLRGTRSGHLSTIERRP